MFAGGGDWQSRIGNFGSALASFMLIWAVVRQYFPPELQHYITRRFSRLLSLLSHHVTVSFPEYAGERLRRSEAFTAIGFYLSASSSDSARRLKAEMGPDSASLLLTMDDQEEVVDVYKGVQMKWNSYVSSEPQPRQYNYSMRAAPPEERLKYYRLTFHRRHRRLVLDEYLRHVMNEGKTMSVKKRQRKLYTNNPSYDYIDFRRTNWSHVPFEHPATFATLAMDPLKKKEIIDDLLVFSRSKDYYSRIGKPWKRGYLLYGPPGTGKSTMIAAMANLLDYDVYDLELTAVRNNSALRKLLIETTSKSIIVIEDIDCSSELTGKRKDANSAAAAPGDVNKPPPLPPHDKEESKVTLSGLLNFIDGLWSSCGGERLIVFTTNHIERLDPALIRRGRMDKHVELSYCGFEGFKILGKNYLDVDEHPLFGRVEGLLGEVKITPADVAERLMPKSVFESVTERNDECLQNLVEVLEDRKANADSEVDLKTNTDAEENRKEDADFEVDLKVNTDPGKLEINKENFDPEVPKANANPKIDHKMNANHKEAWNAESNPEAEKVDADSKVTEAVMEEDNHKRSTDLEKAVRKNVNVEAISTTNTKETGNQPADCCNRSTKGIILSKVGRQIST